MTDSFRALRAVVFSILSLLLLSPAVAQGHGQVPHRGSFVGSPAGVGGRSTLLGRFDGTSTILRQTQNGIEGTFVWVGAHGDAIHGTFAITLTTMIAPGVFLFVEDALITGGTGRFVGATGVGGAVGVINLITGEFAGDFDGLISSVGGKR